MTSNSLQQLILPLIVSGDLDILAKLECRP